MAYLTKKQERERFIAEFLRHRVRPLGITMVQAISIVKPIGVGFGAALRGVDLRLPSTDH